MNDTRPPSRRLRVAHILHRLDVGGMENALVNLVNNLPADEFEHVIVTLAGWSDFRGRIVHEGVRVETVNKRPGKDLDVYFRMHRLLKELRPDVVHTRNWGTIDMQWVAAMASVPRRIHSEHGWDMGDLVGTSAKRLWLRRACKPVIHRLLAVSQDIASWMCGAFCVPPERVTCIPNGVDTARFSPDGVGVPDLPWAGNDLIVAATVGRCEPTKDQGILLEALARLISTSPACRQKLRLVMVGDGPSLPALRQRTRELGLESFVWLPGQRSDIPELLRSVDLFILPSLNEGMSNTILEAMATGLPVIATRVGGNPEMVVPGKTGALFIPRDAEQLAMAIAGYVEEPDRGRSHGSAARRRVEENFSLAKMIASYGATYRAVGWE